jgi:hypothetical protein
MSRPIHHLLRLTILALIFASALPTSLHAQGCTQCRDNAAATPPATRRAYRNAIALLTLTAATIFTTTVLILRRSR